MFAMPTNLGKKQSTTVISYRAVGAYIEVLILEVGNTFTCKAPKGLGEQAELQVVDGNTHSTKVEIFHRLTKPYYPRVVLQSTLKFFWHGQKMMASIIRKINPIATI